MIEARGLRVAFRAKSGTVEALRGLDLAIPRGALFVLLGPNGAGKTTLMRCITGLVRPTGGSISVFGSEGSDSRGSGESGAGRGGGDPARARLARMGVLIENPGAYARLDTREYLSFFGSFYAIPDLDARIRGLCGELGLELGPKPVSKLSQGNRQKLQLARSLLHRPELLLWDEPTDHLDPVSQRDVLGYLRRYLAESGATALVATHRLEQMEAVGSHFGFLSQGSLLAAGDRAAILDGEASLPAGDDSGSGASAEPAAKTSPGPVARARLGFARPVLPEELAWLKTEAAENPLGPMVRIDAVDGDPRSLDVGAPDLRARMPALIKALVSRDLPLASAEPRRASLGDVYHRLVGKRDA
jgi:ABC-2 type transport system ATP-binding protein